MAAFCVSGGVCSGEIYRGPRSGRGERKWRSVCGRLYWMMVQEKFPGDQALVRPSRLRNKFGDSCTSYLIYCVTNKFLLKYSWFTVLCWFQAYSSVIQFHIYIQYIYYIHGFVGGSAVENLPAVWETWVWSPATHSSVLAWETPWTKEPGGLQSMGSQKSDTT